MSRHKLLNGGFLPATLFVSLTQSASGSQVWRNLINRASFFPSLLFPFFLLFHPLSIGSVKVRKKRNDWSVLCHTAPRGSALPSLILSNHRRRGRTVYCRAETAAENPRRGGLVINFSWCGRMRRCMPRGH